MNHRILLTAIVTLAAASTPVLAQNEMFIPILVYRTGPYAPSGIPGANGSRDYYMLVNKRDGGVNGVKLTFEECETQYNTKLGVECYERLKGKGPTGAVMVSPNSTGVAYQIIPKAPVDKIPVITAGYGQTAAADGRVFKWVFNSPTTYWSQASAFIKYIAAQEGGMDKLAGKKVALVYHNSAYGKEPIPTLELLSKKLGYDLKLLAVDHPGQEQRATWLQVRRYEPDWIFLWGWGVMNQVALKEAAAIDFPVDHMIGVWWAGSELDVIPAGDQAIGYKAATFHAPGSDFPLFQEILEHVYGGDIEKARANHWGEVLYNRSVLGSVTGVEAMRIAMAKFGDKPLTGEQVRWGFEHLDVNETRFEELGLGGFTKAVKITCEDHEGNGPVLIQQWDGSKWKIVSDWITPMREIVRPQIEAAAEKYAKENGITLRDCSKEG